eukprot:TRINITY_DN1846_c0_g1_i6.p1 TRINITY_DN1846_c0_g1~~TRINITY_DN1846_c0_g1_i6.p1  ORF type:complete len:327 (-),score=68.76 TRINITY_DN1846_c0_g1_i6:100-1080(-)
MPQMTPGDWICSACGDLQFARNQACRKCGSPKSGGSFGGGGGGGGGNMMAQAQALVEMMSQGGGAGAGIQQMMAMAAGAVGGKAAGGKGFGKGSGGKGGSNANVEQGDWFCASCGDHQFARNAACRKCGAPKSDSVEDASGGFNMGALSSFGGGGGGAQQSMPGDWNCPACGDLQFARNVVCRKCGSPKDGAGGAGAAAGGGGGGAAALMASVMAAMGGGGAGKGAFGGKAGGKGQMVEGDWICPSCGDHQFARNQACRKCGAAKDDGAVLQQHSNAKLLPGDWICPGCGDHQFQRNMQCRKCGMDKPAAETTSSSASASERASPY